MAQRETKGSRDIHKGEDAPLVEAIRPYVRPGKNAILYKEARRKGEKQDKRRMISYKNLIYSCRSVQNNVSFTRKQMERCVQSARKLEQHNWAAPLRAEDETDWGITVAKRLKVLLREWSQAYIKRHATKWFRQAFPEVCTDVSNTPKADASIKKPCDDEEKSSSHEECEEEEAEETEGEEEGDESAISEEIQPEIDAASQDQECEGTDAESSVDSLDPPKGPPAKQRKVLKADQPVGHAKKEQQPAIPAKTEPSPKWIVKFDHHSKRAWRIPATKLTQKSRREWAVIDSCEGKNPYDFVTATFPDGWQGTWGLTVAEIKLKDELDSKEKRALGALWSETHIYTNQQLTIVRKEDRTPTLQLQQDRCGICSLKLLWLTNVKEENRLQRALEVMIEIGVAYAKGSLDINKLYNRRDELLVAYGYVNNDSVFVNRAARSRRQPTRKRPAAAAVEEPAKPETEPEEKEKKETKEHMKK